MGILEQGVKVVTEFLGVGEADASIREQVVTDRQPQPTLRQPEVQAEDTPIENMEDLMEVGKGSVNGDVEESLSEEELEQERSVEEQEIIDLDNAEIFESGSPEDPESFDDLGIIKDVSVKTTPVQSFNTHLSDIKRTENASRKGYVKDARKFYRFKSVEGQGPDKNMSLYEIGFGLKIPKTWLGDDKRLWPKINGVSRNIKEGLNEADTMELTRRSLKLAYKSASKIKTWDKMTEGTKAFWADMVYNGGLASATKAKNPKAIAATERGDIAEGLVLALDFIHSGKGVKKSAKRGALKRKLNTYNKAALSMKGVPVISEYTWDKVAKVKFKYSFTTDKMTDTFKKKLKADDNWLQVSRAKLSASKSKGDKADDNYIFRR